MTKSTTTRDNWAKRAFRRTRGWFRGPSRSAGQAEPVKPDQAPAPAATPAAKKTAARKVSRERTRTAGAHGSPRGSNKEAPSKRRGAVHAAEKPSGRGRTRDQLYHEARQLEIEGRSKMTKTELEHAVAKRRSKAR